MVVLLLFRFAPPVSFAKGLTIPFLLVGLIMGLGGMGDGYLARRDIPLKVELFKKDQGAFFSVEVPQVEKTHRSWRRIRIIWGTLTVIGAALFFILRKEYGLGVGLGLFVLGIAGHVEEAISKRFNERYYREVLEESRKLKL